MASSPRFRAFLSYSRKDEGVANWLHRALERYRTPGRLVWRLDAIPEPILTRAKAPAKDPEASETTGRVIAKVETNEDRSVLTLVDRKSGNLVYRREGPNLELLGFSPRGDRALVAEGYIEGASITVVDTKTGSTVCDYPTAHGLATSAAFAPDGERFAAGTHGMVSIFSVDTRRGLLATMNIAPIPDIHEEGDDGSRPVDSVAFSSDGRLFASASEAGLQIWSADDGSLVLENRLRIEEGKDLRFNADNSLSVIVVDPTTAQSELLTWKPELLALDAKQLIEKVCARAAVRTFTCIEARTDPIVRQIWRTAAGERTDICTGKVN